MFDAPAPGAGSSSAARDVLEQEQAACQTWLREIRGIGGLRRQPGFHDETAAFRMKR
jgi:hypothetical protein